MLPLLGRSTETGVNISQGAHYKEGLQLHWPDKGGWMNEARPWGKGAREGTGGVVRCKGQEAGQSSANQQGIKTVKVLCRGWLTPSKGVIFMC